MVFLSICTALYDYAPQGDNELPLQEGEIVFILEKSSEDDWWKAKKRAPSEEEEEPVGLIPNNYVEEAQPTHHARAMYDYNRQTDEELSFTEEAILSVYDTEDPEWTLVGMDGEYGFVPANYIEITGKAEQISPEPVLTPQSPIREPEPEPEPDSPPPSAAPTQPRHNPAATIAGIMHKKSPSSDPHPTNSSQPPRRPQLTPEASDEEAPAPSLPRRPPSEQLSPPPTQYASPRSPDSPGIAASPPHNRVVSQKHDEDRPQPSPGGFHLYNITEVVSAMGKNKKLPTTLGLNTATGTIMIAPEKSRDGPQMEWTAEKLTNYSIEGKHVFIELVRPSKSVDFHAGAKDTAHEIVAGLGEIAGASRAEGLREIIDAGTGGGLRKAKIIYDFMAQGDDEVTVAVDDDVAVLDDTKSDEWWMVRRLKNGREGVVPSSFVEITGVMPPPRTSSGINAGKSIVEQNRLEEERLAKEAVKNSKERDVKGPPEVGPGLKLPTRGSSKARGDTSNSSSQRNHKKNKHSKSDSSSKSKPDMTKTRTWTDRSGTFKVEAQFIGLKDGKIHLHKLNGVKIAVPVVKMAAEDLEYVEQATGVSLDDDKPLSEIRRKNTQKDGDRKKSQAGVSKPGATVEQPKSAPPKSDGPEYDWFDFFLKTGVSPYQCERYASNFNKDSMDENILGDITPTVLRTLGLKEGDILRVMKYLDVKFGRTGTSAPDDANGGLFSGPGGALRNNTRKGRPAPPIESNDVVDASKLGQKEQTNNKQSDRAETPFSKITNPPEKGYSSFGDDAWDVKPSKQAAPEPVSKPAPAPPPAATAPPQQPTITGSLLDLSLLSEPLQPEKVQPKPAPAVQPQQAQVQPAPQAPQQQQPQIQQQPIQQQPTGANPTFFSQIGQQPTGQQFPQQNASQPQTQQGFGTQQNYQNQQQPQQINPTRQRPPAPPQSQSTQQGALMPPPPSRPLSAPQTQPQNSNFGPPPLQPQLTGYQPHSQLQNQLAQPGQSLNDLSQQRFQQQHFNQQQQQPGQQQFGQQQPQPQQTGFGQQPQQIQPQQTGFGQGYNQFNNGIIPQPTGFGQSFNPLPQQQPGLQNMQNPYINGQQAGSPFADPRTQQQQPGGFQPLQPQPTGFQPQYQQPQQTGINSMLAPALQPQPTGVNGFSRPGFGQPPHPIPPMPPMPQEQPAAAPLIPQKTGPAPPVRFGTPAAPKLVPQRTGRANLAAATPSNPFGF